MRIFNNRPLTITLLVAVIIVVLMIIIPPNSNLGIAGNIAGGAVAGIENFFRNAFDAVGKFFTYIFNPSDIEKENIALKEQLATLQQKLKNMEELEKENQRLSALLDYTLKEPDYDYITVRVIAKDPGYWFDMFTVNAGQNMGVEVDDCVITPDGLVGRVVEVYGTWSKVMAIIDSRSSVSCIIERTRDNGIVNGGLQLSEESGLCHMEFLPLEAKLLPGDTVITSGLGGVFPKGLAVGSIKEVINADSTTGKQVIITPAVDFLHLEEVMIVKEKPQNSQ